MTMRHVTRRAALAAGGLAALAAPALRAQGAVSDGVVKLGVLNDMSGVFADQQGMGDVVSARMAIEDFGGRVLGAPIELIHGDLQNRADVGLAIARRWFDQEKVDAIFGIGNSAVALAVQPLAQEKRRIAIATAPGTTELTGRACAPLGVQWTYDNYALAKGTVTPLVRGGGRKWFFITSDYAFGHSLEQNAAELVRRLGGEVTGAVRAPLGETDYSSHLLRAAASGANVVGIAAAATLALAGGRATAAGGEHLFAVEREGREARPAARRPAVQRGAQPLGAVAEHRHLVARAGGQDGVQLARLAVDVHRHHRARQPPAPRGGAQFLPQQPGVERPGPRADIEEARHRAHLHGGGDGRDESEARRPDLVARGDVQHAIGQVQRRRAGGGGEHMREAGGGADRGLEGRDGRPRRRHPAAVEHGAQVVHLVARQMRRREVDAPHRGRAQAGIRCDGRRTGRHQVIHETSILQ